MDTSVVTTRNSPGSTPRGSKISSAPHPAEPELFALVIPDLPAVGREFVYSVPERFRGRVEIGTQVRVEVHGRRVGGWVSRLLDEAPAGLAIRPIAAVRGTGPPAAILDLARWASWRWAGATTFSLRTGSSERVVAGLPPMRPLGTAPPPRPASQYETGSTWDPTPGTTVVRIGPSGDRLGLVMDACDLLWRRPDGDFSSGVLVLAPSHAQSEEAARRLRAAGYPVALLPDDWAMARAGSCVVVGTVAGAFAPLERLCAAVVLDAHDEAYHAESAPTWCAWEVVEERARRDGAPLALVSPCPTLDLLHGRKLVLTGRAAERRAWPAVEVVDMREVDPRAGLFSERLVALARWAAEGDEIRRVVCVLNRTGRARLVICGACNAIARCERCGGALSQKNRKDRKDHEDSDTSEGPAEAAQSLRCERCGYERAYVCAECGSVRLKAFRPGVSKVRDELEVIAGTEVAEISGAPSKAPQEVVARLVVGTEAALHRVGRADAVVLLEFDSELLAPRLRAAEEALALLARASRLVSRSARGPGRVPGGAVVVQTRMPEHATVSSAVRADPALLSDTETTIRTDLGLPPFSALARISGASAEAYCSELVGAAPLGIGVFGPTEGEWRVVAPDHSMLCDLLASVRRPAGKLRIEVDPVRA
jgi:primosomal protein N' (replication factor Y)